VRILLVAFQPRRDVIFTLAYFIKAYPEMTGRQMSLKVKKTAFRWLAGSRNRTCSIHHAIKFSMHREAEVSIINVRLRAAHYSHSNVHSSAAACTLFIANLGGLCAYVYTREKLRRFARAKLITSRSDCDNYIYQARPRINQILFNHQ